MPSITFESLSSSLSRLPEVIKSIPDLLRDPSANPLQSGILLGIFVTFVLIILVSIVLMAMRPPVDDEEFHESDEEYFDAEEDVEGDEDAVEGAEEDVDGDAEADLAITPTTAPARSGSRLTVASIALLTLVVVWVVAGISTSTSAVCSSCHADTPHAAAGPKDPHASVSCVDCHEGGGSVARVTVNVATRLQHFILAPSDPKHARGYGKPVASDGCLSCHHDQISGTFNNRTQGVLVSHKEPLAAGAQCVDCHVLASGAVSARTVGMAPCLRCHNGKTAKAGCAVCHTGDPALAIRSTVTSSTASVLVPNPQCGSCHTDMTKCDACHGVRMPHSVEFQKYGHARPAALEIWTTGSAKSCSKCHYPGHNGCVAPACHLMAFPAHPSPTWRTMHTLSPWSGSATACSCHTWNSWDHNGMTYCEICHPTKPPTAKP